MSEHWLSVVTVVKDDPAGLERTISSLADQDLAGVQYVVVDSSSIRAAMPNLGPADGFEIVLDWLPPQGVYAAMNAGLDRASGRYVYFANAGDVLRSGVLAEIRPALAAADPLWAFGGVRFVPEGGGPPVPEPAWSYDAEFARLFARRRFPPHQGVIMRADELRRQGGFDESYRVVADYVTVLKAARQAPPLELDLILATFEVGGLSTTQWRQGLAEFHRARREVFAPTGLAALRERLDTAQTWVLTSAHRAVSSVRSSR